jgi:hypothetical protein
VVTEPRGDFRNPHLLKAGRGVPVQGIPAAFLRSYEHIPAMVTVQVTRTLPVWMVLSFFSLITGEMVWTAYCRVQPLAVTTSFK